MDGWFSEGVCERVQVCLSVNIFVNMFLYARM